MGTKHAAGIAAIAACSFFTLPFSASASDIFYSGRATGIDGQVTIASTPVEVLVADTGMSCQGLPHDESVASFSNPAPLQVSAQDIHVHTLGKDGKAASDATMQTFNLGLTGLAISADSVGAHAQAVCDVSSGTVTTTGHSDLSNVVVNGQAIDTRAKRSVQIPNVGYVYFDQHHRYGDEMRVYAIHVRLDNPALPTSGDVYIGKVRAKTICNP